MLPKDNVPRFRGSDVPVSQEPKPLDEGRGGIWETDTFHKTARQAADEFAATFWDSPRKALAIDPHGCFRVKGGQRLYQVRLVGPVGTAPAVYRVTVMGPE